ncbi:hypothetical protein V500_05135 [Pseudogymnoascus sp. VKM F-4518 (FW-2643)]|nr:hypothetical protein V500_05135 [Pseudogymnoascus sp. VKM F-4518 (FW-2643)]
MTGATMSSPTQDNFSVSDDNMPPSPEKLHASPGTMQKRSSKNVVLIPQPSDDEDDPLVSETLRPRSRTSNRLRA